MQCLQAGSNAGWCQQGDDHHKWGMPCCHALARTFSNVWSNAAPAAAAGAHAWLRASRPGLQQPCAAMSRSIGSAALDRLRMRALAAAGAARAPLPPPAAAAAVRRRGRAMAAAVVEATRPSAPESDNSDLQSAGEPHGCMDLLAV